MFKRYVSFTLLIIISLFMSTTFISAQDVGVDDQGNPNDPTINDRANACYTDPRFEDQCDTPIEWFCGYTIIRYDYSLINRIEVEAVGCGGYLPPEAGLIPEASSNENTTSGFAFPGIGCVLVHGFYDNFMGGNYLPNDTTSFANDDCTLPAATLAVPVVYAPEGPVAATQLCIENGHSGLGAQNEGDFYSCDL